MVGSAEQSALKLGETRLTYSLNSLKKDNVKDRQHDPCDGPLCVLTFHISVVPAPRDGPSV